MLMILGVVMAVATVSIIRSVWWPGSASSTPIGWMSEQWLAEHRASNR